MPIIEPLTPERWGDFETLFGPNGACGGCWCMWWRVSAKEFEAGSDVNRDRMRALVFGAAGEPAPGLLAYDDEGVPVGWCSLGPRPDFGSIERSRDLAAPADDGQSLWGIVCFYIAAGRRGQGIARSLLDAAVAYAARHGADAVEGYAVDPTRRKFTNSELYTGTVGLFEAAGFRPVHQAKPTSRIVMRRPLS